MSDAPNRNESRLLELLADRALCGLTEFEQRELEAMCQEQLASPTCPMEFCELDAAAAEVAAAMCSREAPPASVQAKLNRAADLWCAENCSIVGRVAPGASVNAGLTARPGGALAYLGWVAAAACLAFAVWMSSGTGGAGPGTLPILSASERLARFESEAKDVVAAAWSPFNTLDDKKEPPEQSGVTGTVKWSESKQTGFITLKGIKPNDAKVEQYQLWIVDSRGLGQRISGALFNATPDPVTGEVIVPIEPRITVDKAGIFAITIEKPGGVWVSDMSRRVVLAALPKS